MLKETAANQKSALPNYATRKKRPSSMAKRLKRKETADISIRDSNLRNSEVSLPQIFQVEIAQRRPRGNSQVVKDK